MTAERSWDWHVGEDPGLRCPVDKTITLDANGLSYTGWCDDPAWGGGYTIGSQTVHEFLELMAVVADPGRFLARVDTHLDSVPITPGRPLTPGDEVVFFAGSIGLDDHVVGAVQHPRSRPQHRLLNGRGVHRRGGRALADRIHRRGSDRDGGHERSSGM